MKSIPPLNWLRAFEAVARHNSFSKAAQELSVTVSAVSQHIKSLENYLSITLFERHPRLRLTDAGKHYLPTVTQSFSQLEIATNDIFGQSHNVVRLHCGVAFSTLVISPRLADFRRQYPDIEIQFHNSVWWQRRHDNRRHLEIRYGDGNWQEPSQLLAHDALTPMVGKDYPAITADYPTFQHHDLLQVSGLRHNWYEWFKRANIHPIDTQKPAKPIIYSDSVLPIYLMTLQNQGIALLSRCYTNFARKQGELIQPFTTLLPTRESFYLIQPEKLNLAEQQFSQWLIEQCRELA